MRAQRPSLTLNDLDLLFRFCNQLKRNLDRLFDDHHGLTFYEAHVFHHIARSEGSDRNSTVTGIDEALALGNPTRKAVTKLLALGWVEAHSWLDDRRKPLRLTDQGRLEFQAQIETWQQCGGNPVGELPSESLKNLAEALRELKDAPDELRMAFERQT